MNIYHLQAYVMVITAASFKIEHELNQPLTDWESAMWFCAFGYITAEISELFLYGRGYFSETSNWIDMFIITLWSILAGLRFGCMSFEPPTLLEMAGDGSRPAGNSTTTKEPTTTSAATEEYNECTTGDAPSVLLFHFMFCLLLVILWTRLTLIFKRSNSGLFAIRTLTHAVSFLFLCVQLDPSSR